MDTSKLINQFVPPLHCMVLYMPPVLYTLDGAGQPLNEVDENHRQA